MNSQIQSQFYSPPPPWGTFFRKTEKCDIFWSMHYINLKQMKEKNYLQVAEKKRLIRKLRTLNSK